MTYEGETYSVTSIGKDAFNYCSSLTEVTIPSSVTSIGWAAFSKCSLTKVTIPNSVVSIDIGAFCYCPNLTEVTIPNSVTSIGNNAFGNCPNLTEVTIGSNVTSISDYTFQSCRSLAKMHIPNSVTSIGERAFFFCSSLTELTIGNSVTSIGYDAFAGCSSLTELTIPNSVTTIDRYAFSGCSGLTEVTIGNSVTSIGKRTFRDCSSLTTLYSLNPTPPSAIDYVGDSAFDDNHYMTVDVYVPQEALEAYRSADVWKEFKKLQDFEYNAVEEVSTASKQIQSANGQITVTGLTDGTTVTVYDLSGRQIGTAVSTNGQTIINPNLAPGSIAIVKIGDRSIKITMK